MSIGRLIEDVAQERGDSPHLRFEDTVYTFGDLSRDSNRAANALRDLGVKAGDKVALVLNNAPEYLHVWFGLAKMGAAMAPVNVHSRGEGLAYVLRHCEAKVLVIHPDLYEAWQHVAAQVPNIGTVVVPAEQAPEGTINLFEIMRQAEPERTFDLCDDPRALMGILYTSGTTGPSKGVMLNHNTYLNTGDAFMKHMIQSRPDDVLYTFLPLFHCNAQQLTTMGSLVGRRRMSLSARFSASRFWDDIRKHGATIFNYLGAVVTMIFKQPEKPDDADNPVRLTFGAAAPKEIWEAFEKRFGLTVVEGFGLTETATVCHCNPHGAIRVGSIGKPMPHFESRIVGADDKEVPPGTPGEICVRPKRDLVMMDGYFKMPEKTAEAMRGGWFHSGDRGRMDEDGYFYFMDRMKDCIRRRGENISSFELEKVLNQHPDVQESVAIGTPSELGEEDVMVVVVAKEGRQPTPESIVDYCFQNMAYFMVPRFIRFVKEMPKTPTQRVQKFKLREEGTAGAWDREKAGYRVRDKK